MQVIIIKNTQEEFEQAVNEKLTWGYTVVPGTLTITVLPESGYTLTKWTYIIVLEYTKR